MSNTDKEITLEMIYEKLLELEQKVDHHDDATCKGIERICEEHRKQERQLNKL